MAVSDTGYRGRVRQVHELLHMRHKHLIELMRYMISFSDAQSSEQQRAEWVVTVLHTAVVSDSLRMG